MTDTSLLVNDALKVSFVLERLKFQGDISKITRVTLDFISLKSKMTPANIGTVVRTWKKIKRNSGILLSPFWLIQSDG